MSLTTNPPVIGVNILSGGTSGYSGYSGIGTSGYSGISGYSGLGLSGYSGISGYSGQAFPTKYYAESLGESSTTSATYVNKLTMTQTPVAGTYILQWNCSIVSSNTSNNVGVKVSDGTNIYFEAVLQSSINYSNNGWMPVAGFIQLTLPATSISYYIDWLRVANTAYIKNAKLLLWRIA